MTINKKELVEIRSGLLASGYTEADHSFTHPKNPLIFITVSEEKEKSKYSKVKFKLSRAVEEREIIFSPSLRLKLKNQEAELFVQ